MDNTYDESRNLLQSASDKVIELSKKLNTYLPEDVNYGDYVHNLELIGIDLWDSLLRPTKSDDADCLQFAKVATMASESVRNLLNEHDITRIVDPSQGPNDEDVLRIFIERRRITRLFESLRYRVESDT